MPALPELDLARIHRFCDDESPAHVRDQVRVEAAVRGTKVTILECRAPWSPEIKEWSRQPLAQLRYNAEFRRWTLYWADSNDRWHLYDRIGPGSVDKLLKEIGDDPTAIFWG